MNKIINKSHSQIGSPSQSDSALTQKQAVAYGLPLLAISFLVGPITVLQGIYAKHFGVALTTIAAVLFIARLFDAISDPIIGYCADRYYGRHGHRKPFIITGGILFIVASWFLYVPPVGVSDSYFLIWFLAFYLAYTLFEIPHLAWGSQLATDSREKNRVYGIRSLFAFLGTLLFFCMPLLPWFETNEITPETLKWSVLVSGALMLPMLYLSIKTVPNRERAIQNDQQNNRLNKRENWRVALRAIYANKPLLVLTCAHICTGFGSGMWFTLLFIVVDSYLGLGGQFALVYVISFAISILSLRLWYLLANYWSKQAVWIAAMVLVIAGLLGTGLLSNTNTGWLELLLCMTLISSGFACFNIMMPSLLSDVVDYGTWKFGTDLAATYFSLYTFVNKAIGALGGALALAIAGWVSFDPSVTTHSDFSIAGVRFAIAWIPAFFVGLSIIFISRIPITLHRHAVIRRRLDSLASRAARTNQNPRLPNDQTTSDASASSSIQILTTTP